DLPAVGPQGGKDLPHHLGEVDRVDRRGDLLEELVLEAVEEGDGDLAGVDDAAPARAEAFEPSLEEKGLAVGEQEAGLHLEAEEGADGGLHDLFAALGDLEDLRQ